MDESTPFVNASDIPQLDQNLLDDYYYAKLQLMRWEQKEGELKDKIKQFMTSNCIERLNSTHLFLSCHKIERIFYPKQKIESLVPPEILEKIRTVSELIILQAKLK